MVEVQWMLQPTVPMKQVGEARTPCPKCLATDWVERPDGTAICGHCVFHTGTGASTTGDFTNCKTCLDAHWEDVMRQREKKAKKRRKK
jgi:hypothetical protein